MPNSLPDTDIKNSVQNCMSDASETGTGFLLPFLAPISGKSVMGISLEALEKLRAVLDRRQIAVQCQVDWSSAVRRLHDPEASGAVMRGIWRAAGAAAAAAAANVI